MKILFIGCVKTSEVFLKAIFNETDAEIIGVVTMTESNYNADHVALNGFCEENKIDWLDFSNNEQLLQWVKDKRPDIIYCFGWSYLLPLDIYSLPPLGAVGYHPTLLPRNRGRHPIIWALVLGLQETGSTFFYLTDIPDAGDILSQEKVTIDPFEDANSLYNKLLVVGEKQVIELTNNLMNHDITPIKQNEQETSYWRKRSRKDGKIDWRMSSKSIVNLINALTKPYVGAHFEHDHKDIIVWKAVIENSPVDDYIEPGKIIYSDHNSFVVKTADGCLRVLEYEGEFRAQEGEYL